MKNCDKQNLIISIESSIDFIESHLDSADKTIAFVFKKHSVTLRTMRRVVRFQGLAFQQ